MLRLQANKFVILRTDFISNIHFSNVKIKLFAKVLTSHLNMFSTNFLRNLLILHNYVIMEK